MHMHCSNTARRGSVTPVRTVRHTTIVSFMPAQSASVPSASPVEAEAESKKGLKKPSAGVLQSALGCFIHLDSTSGCNQPMQLALDCAEYGERFLLESTRLLCAHTNEIDAGRTSPCILEENHNAQSEYASI